MIKEFIENKLTTYTPKVTDIGIGGFILSVTTSESIDMNSSIATAYVESGDYVNDHITNAPLSISFEGEAGNIHIKESASFQSYKKIAAVVGKITPRIPKRTETQISNIFGLINKVNDTIANADGYIEDGLGLYNFIKGNQADKKATPQEEFLKFFTMVYETRVFIEVEAFGKIYKEMAIESLSIKRTDDSFVSYSIKLKQLRFAKTTVTKVKGLKNGKKKGITKTSMSAKKSLGTVKPKIVPPATKKSAITRVKNFAGEAWQKFKGL